MPKTKVLHTEKPQKFAVGPERAGHEGVTTFIELSGVQCGGVVLTKSLSPTASMFGI